MAMDDWDRKLRDEPIPSATKVALSLARAKLNRATPPENYWKLVGAAALAASSALILAVAIIMGPPTLPGRQTDVNPWMR